MERLRDAGPNERRCIVRQELGTYRTLVIGGTYTISKTSDESSLKTTLIKALKHCVAIHPILSAAIVGGDTESPTFARPATLDLDNHIDLLGAQQTSDLLDEKSLVKLTLAQANDHVFTRVDEIPPWKVTVLPLPNHQDENCRCLILFGYYHSHGDGKSGLAFHKTFLHGLRLARGPDCAYSEEAECVTPNTSLLPTMEMAGKLHVSWKFLLSPLLGAYLPSFIANPLGIRASATPEAHDQWVGRPQFFDPDDFRTGLEVITIGHGDLHQILQNCRAHDVKFTGLLHQTIVRALSKVLPSEKAGCFVSATAVDLRANLNGITDDDMALCPSAYYELFPRTAETEPSGLIGKDTSLWDAARSTTHGLAKCAATLNDQPVGLLAYLSKMYPWMRGQIGKRREQSYEVSNILCFNPGPSQPGADIESMIFSQPANALSGCLNFNVVSRYQGDLVITVTWQLGALDVEDEQEFVEKVGASMTESLKALGKAQ